MKVIDHIFDMSEKIIDMSSDVSINWYRLNCVIDNIMKNSPPKIKQVDKHVIKSSQLDRNVLLKELVSDSVNYCYWQYNSRYRPNDAGSTKMRELLEEYFDTKLAWQSQKNFQYQLRRFYKAMMLESFPLMDKRLTHLMALSRSLIIPHTINRNVHKVRVTTIAESLISMIMPCKIEFEKLFNFLIMEVDGFGEDPFLKRAILFFLQLNRIYGLYEEDIKQLPIPADYQVPKMLVSYGILTYSSKLSNKIELGEHLKENGPEDMAIRAGAIVAARRIGERLGWSPADVDGWFFKRRNESKAPFHCCITSNY